MSIFEILGGHLGETSEPGDYGDLKEKKEGIINGQILKEKTSQESPMLGAYQTKYHNKEVYTSKIFN